VIFSLTNRIQTETGAQPASYPMGTGGSYPGDKAAGTWSWPSLPSSAEVKYAWNYNFTPPVPSWRGASRRRT